MRARALRLAVLWTTLPILAGLLPADAGAQVVVDAVVRRLGTRVITRLDLRKVRVLQLFAQTPQTDDGILRELENRALVLAELDRFPLEAPTGAQIAARRAEWVSRVGSDVAARTAHAGMTDEEVNAWFRDDRRITQYLDTRFGAMPPEDRPAAINRWIMGLRERAFLR